MPKHATAKHSVIARNEVTSLYERISLSKETRDRYKDVCRPRKIRKPEHKPIIHRTHTTAEWVAIQRAQREEAAAQELFSRLTMEERKLEDRISSPPPPLIERIAPVRPDYQPPAPIPKRLRFRKESKIRRIPEFKPLINATYIRLKPLFEKLQKEEAKLILGLAARVPKEHQDLLWVWWNAFQEICADIDEDGHRYTHSQFRDISGACKRIKPVPFHDLERRLPEICSELVELKITFPTAKRT